MLILLGFSYYQLTKSEYEFQGTPLKEPKLIEGVELQHVSLGSVNLSKWQGNILIMFFGFTHCPDICPLTLGRLAKVYRDLGEPEDLQVIMVSIDPKRDTPEIVQNYASNFHASFIGLSGSAGEVASAAKNFFVGYKELPNQKEFIHTDSLAILDREGYMRLVYSQSNILAIAEDLKVILKQKF